MIERPEHPRIQGVRDLEEKIVGVNRIVNRQAEVDHVTAQFLAGLIDEETHYRTLEAIEHNYQNIPRITVSNPWALYGLIRFGVGMSAETTARKVMEEVRHFVAAKKNGINAIAVLEAEYQQQEDSSLELTYWAFVIGYITKNDQQVKEKIAATVTAAGDLMSNSDLAKLGNTTNPPHV